jgi:hypothetical protein
VLDGVSETWRAGELGAWLSTHGGRGAFGRGESEGRGPVGEQARTDEGNQISGGRVAQRQKRTTTAVGATETGTETEASRTGEDEWRKLVLVRVLALALGSNGWMDGRMDGNPKAGSDEDAGRPSVSLKARKTGGCVPSLSCLAFALLLTCPACLEKKPRIGIVIRQDQDNSFFPSSTEKPVCARHHTTNEIE